MTAALLSLHKQSQRIKLFLTQVGGGSFGNPNNWIVKALHRSLDLYCEYNIDVIMVHYSHLPDKDSDHNNPFIHLEKNFNRNNINTCNKKCTSKN